MPQNREFRENGNVDSEEGINNPKDRQRREKSDLGSAVSEIMKLQADPGLRERELEHLTGGVGNKQVYLAVAKQMHPCYEKWDSGNVTHPSKSRSLELQFLDEPSDPVWTGKKIKGKEHTSIRIALVDVLTGQVVKSGHEASLKVEIVVLKSDFNGYEGNNWSVEEFDSKIVRKIEGRKFPLSGDVSLNLIEGIGFIGNVYFPHAKSWMKRHEFRLGARIVGCSNGVRVREAKTEPFVVKDRRGNLYGKHHPPSLSDAVWRLEVIGKDGAFHQRLSKENINTVKDFLTQLNINPRRLKQILGVSMFATMWDITVEHARTCKIDQKAYLYYSPISQQVTAVIFNVVGQLMGLLMGQHFVYADTLSETEKADAQKLVVLAFEHWGEVIAVDDATSLMAGSQQLANAPYPSNLITVESPITGHLHGNIQLNTTSTEIISLGGTITLDDFGSLCFQELHYTSEQGQFPNSGIYDPESARQDVNDENPNFLNVPSFLPNVLYPSNPTITESSYDTQILTSHNILRSYDPELVPSSRDTVPYIGSIWDVNFLGDYDLQCIDNTSHRYEETLTFISPDTNSLICEPESTFEAIYEFEQVQISESLCSVQSQDSNWKLQGDPSSAVNDNILLAGSLDVTVNKPQRRQLSKSNAQRRWSTLFSIMRWFSVRRDVARKTLLVEIGKDPNASSQANLQSAVNGVLSAHFAAVPINNARKRYLSKRDEVQTKWRMLFSVMRWFSVKRKVARKTAFRETPKNLSASFGDIKPPIYSITGTNSLNYEQPLSFPAHITEPRICVAGSMTWPVSEDAYMQLLDAHFSNPQSGANETPCSSHSFFCKASIFPLQNLKAETLVTMPVERSGIGRSSSFGDTVLSVPVATAAKPPIKSSKAVKPSVGEKSVESPSRIFTLSSPVEESVGASDEEQIGEFLDKCYYCKKKIRENAEVFMYSNFRAFCAVECRDKQIAMDHETEKASGKSNRNKARGRRRKVARKTAFGETPKNHSASFGDIKLPICSITGTNSLNNEQPLSFPAYITEPPTCVARSMTWPICEDTYMQLLDAQFSNPQSGQ